jgi:hypothetical protein
VTCSICSGRNDALGGDVGLEGVNLTVLRVSKVDDLWKLVSDTTSPSD